MDPWREIALFGQRVCATRDPLGVQDIALTSMLHIVGADAAGLYVLDARQRPRQVSRLGACDALVYEIESLGRNSDPFLRQLLTSRQPVDDCLLYGTTSHWPQRCERGRILAAHGFAHSMVVPLLYDSRLIATINLARSKGSPPFAVHDGRVAMELGRFTTIALANALQHAQANPTAAPADAPIRTVPLGPASPYVLNSGDSLTHREREVLDLVGAGLRNNEIAGELNVTVHTVKQHLKNAYSKLGVRTRLEAVQRLQADDEIIDASLPH